MSMRKKLIAYSALPVLGLGLLGVSSIASAHGFGGGMGIGLFSNATPEQLATRQQDMFAREAQLLGISVDDVKVAWADGKTLQQLAQDHGITQDQLATRMKDAALAQLTTNLQDLVSQGIITQAQADKRLAFMQTQTANRKAKGFARGRGHGMGMME